MEEDEEPQKSTDPKTSSKLQELLDSQDAKQKAAEEDKKSESKPSRGRKSSKDIPVKRTRSESLQRMSQTMIKAVRWTMTDFFDFNPKYCAQVRGIMNILNVFLSLIAVCLLGSFCQLRPYPDGASEGFFCKAPETFLFVVNVTVLIISFIFLFSCLLSKRTDAVFAESNFEITYYILFFVIMLTASITQLISSLSVGSSREMYYANSKSPNSAGILSFVNSLLFGISAAWFFISHRYYDKADSEPDVESQG